jgi:hypothetical protein
MALNTVSLPFGYYPDPTKGRPVFNGSIFIGEPDLDPTILANQKTITIRQEGVDTPSVPQPISTSAGGVPVFNGSPAEILVDGSYSMAVLNAQDAQVYYVASQNDADSFSDTDLRYGPIFATVAAMVAADPVSLDGVVVDLVVGMRVAIDDYATGNDSGIIFGRVVGPATGTADGGSFIDLANSNQFKQNFPTVINTKLFGDTAADSVDSYALFQAAFDYVGLTAGRDTVEISNGVRSISQQLRIYGNNRYVFGPNATLRRDYNTSPTGNALITVNGTPENIEIHGGIFDVNGTNFTTSANALGWIGGSNIKITGTTFLNVPDFHAIDIADSTGVYIDKCNFLGFSNPSAARDFSEAIQLDADIDNGGNDNFNIWVTNCIFGDNPDNTDPLMLPWPVAMGNHGANEGNFNRDVIFDSNVVTGATLAGVRVLNFSGASVTNNTFNDCVQGVLFEFKKKVAIGYDASANVSVIGNKFLEMTGSSVTNGTPGFTTANGNAKHSGITISNNTVRGSGVKPAFDVMWWQNSEITNNNIRSVDTGIQIRFCSQLATLGNQVVVSTTQGIFVRETGETDFSGQDLTNDIKVSGNHLNDIGLRAILVSGALLNIDVTDNKIVEPSTAGTVEGIRVDGGVDLVSVIGNTVTGTLFNTGISTPGNTRLTMTGNAVEIGTLGNAYANTSVDAVIDMFDDDTPEGRITAGIGSVFKRLNGGAGTSFYVKESGTGNTGWVAK